MGAQYGIFFILFFACQLRGCAQAGDTTVERGREEEHSRRGVQLGGRCRGGVEVWRFVAGCEALERAGGRESLKGSGRYRVFSVAPCDRDDGRELRWLRLVGPVVAAKVGFSRLCWTAGFRSSKLGSGKVEGVRRGEGMGMRQRARNSDRDCSCRRRAQSLISSQQWGRQQLSPCPFCSVSGCVIRWTAC